MTETPPAGEPHRARLRRHVFNVGETRGWITLGLFALTGEVVYLVATRPELDNNKLFFSLATLIVGTCFGGAIGYWFGFSKGASDAPPPAGES